MGIVYSSGKESIKDRWTVSGLQVLDLLKQGVILAAADRPLLVMGREDKVKISSPSLTMRITREDFLEVYGEIEFTLLPKTDGIDESRDEAYYAWRALKQ